ncbi:copper-binding protein [Marinobacterium zhoushanense]|uniref:Copper-binding protein n=1 Tax=Marinobacterium zhoushanense TaxID=1679163 RepID=A0ABQ1KDY6_9GAMM|nr:cupredoxin domain-containing protein [Marinobacterium zhoushanense]GGB92499.1 copper-binding protein [Marinobacterium zhoushanense]
MMLLINLLGLLLIALIVWWFWLHKGESTQIDSGEITINVNDGVYDPAHIRVPAGQPATLRFLRKDPSPCASVVVFSDFDISQELPLNKTKDVRLQPMQPGRYPFTCQMQMYRGELIVE